MRGLALQTAAALLLFGGATPSIASPQQQTQDAPAQAAPADAYPNSVDGLKKFLGDIFATMRSGGDTTAYFANLEIPNSAAWFPQVFGPKEGPRLDDKYKQVFAHPNGDLRGRFDRALENGDTDLQVTVLQQPLDQNARLGRAILEAMVRPTLLYSASGTSPNEKYPVFLGQFVYVDGGFRYLDFLVFQALSNAPPLRIKLGGQVQAAKIVSKVEPIYPAEARAAQVAGPVVLHVIIGTNGTMQQIDIVSGDPTLAQAATEAVRRWKYQPTLLNGMQVEVDTTITISFVLNAK